MESENAPGPAEIPEANRPVVPPPKPKRRSYFVILLLLLLIIGVILVAWQPLEDWVKLRGYSPPSAITQLATQDTMTSYARHLFYLNKPQLLSSVTAFRQDCPENKDTIVLGCYHPDQDGIYIYNVADPTLAGVTQVTAAHEVLHAVYARLSSSDRNKLDSELESFYKNDLKDSRVLAEVKLYQQTEPGSVFDEMSCTFGTEIADLPTGLNNYYQKYFTNRSVIVAYEQQYQGAFTTRENTITADDQQLSAMKAQIDRQNMTLAGELSNLQQQQAQMNSLKSSGQIDTYNADVPGYNAAVNDYNAGVTSLQATIATYDDVVVARNSVAGELTTLDKALDTRLTTQSTQ